MDASIVDAATSTKNAKRERDPEMHQTKNGNQWYFGMKAHIGVDAESGLAHTLATTAAIESDVTTAHEVLLEAAEVVQRNAGHTGSASARRTGRARGLAGDDEAGKAAASTYTISMHARRQPPSRLSHSEGPQLPP